MDTLATLSPVAADFVIIAVLAATMLGTALAARLFLDHSPVAANGNASTDEDAEPLGLA